MKRVSTLLLVLSVASGVFAATRPSPVPPIFINNNPVQPPAPPPQVDATIFWNRSLFIASNDFLFPNAQPLPYYAQSVRFWTNNGVMLGLPGFDFQYVPNPAHLTSQQRRKQGANVPQPSALFFNDGEITVSDFLSIRANNIVNSGTLLGDTRARLRLSATNGLADLSRGAFRVGELPLPDCTTGGGFGFDPLVRSIYTAFGTNGSVNSNQFWAPLSLPNLGLTLQPPFSAPPPFQRILITPVYPGAPATNRSTNLISGLQHCGDYGSFVHIITNVTQIFTGSEFRSITNLDVNMVFVPTNGFNENASVDVRFPTNFFFSRAPIVEFRTPDFDVVEQKQVTNFVTFNGGGFFGSATPFRGRDCLFDTYDGPNAPYAPELFYDPRFFTNSVRYLYTAGMSEMGNTNSFYYTNSLSRFVFTELGKSPAASDPTNFNGTVQIKARNLNLAQTRIRGENAVDIYTSNLLANAGAAIDSPFINFDASTTNSSMVISNLVRPIVNRLQGTFESWTAQWSASVIDGLSTNTIVTNGTNLLIVVPVLATWNYQVLVLGSCITTEQPAIMHKFTLHATNMVIHDKLAVNNAFRLDGKSARFGPGSSLSLPYNTSLAFTNLIGITRLTNEGVLNIPRAAFFGSFEDGYVQPPLPKRNARRPQLPRLVTYESLVNRNTITASGFSARSAYVEIAGPQFFPALLQATNGAVKIDGATVVISNAAVQAQSDILITAGNFLAAQSTLDAGATNGTVGNYLPGSLVIDATNSINDGGINAGNQWLVTHGARVLRRPANGGDLMGTRLISRASTFAQSVHVWAGQNRGVSPAGFTNNLALARLTLDGAKGTSFRFQGAGVSNALYVEYLELVNFPSTNYALTGLSIASDFTIYFADSNVSADKLDGIFGGRVRWVSSYVGPRSSTNIVYPNGLTYTFNSALASNPDFDSDGDGVNNDRDCTPLIPPGEELNTNLWFGALCPAPGLARASDLSSANIGLAIALDAAGRQVALDWNAPASSVNTVEFTESLAAESWQTLTNFINGPVDARVTVKDAVGAPLRVYRVRVDAGKP